MVTGKFARWAAAQGVTADIGQGSVRVGEWAFDDRGGTGQATFGPYPSVVSADGVTIVVDGASEWRAFGSRLTLPAGLRFHTEVRLGGK